MKHIPKAVLIWCLSLCLQMMGWARGMAAVQDGGAYYIVSDYYQKVLGMTADGSKPRLSAIGTNVDADSYVFIAEASATEGFYYLKNKSTGQYLAASTSDTWSLVFKNTKGSGDEYLWAFDVQFGKKIVSKKNTSKRLGCDWSEEDYVPVYYDKAAASMARFTVVPALAKGYEASLLAAKTDRFQNDIHRVEQDYYQVAESIELNDTLDLHIVSDTPFAGEASINIRNRESWVIFENHKPSEVMEHWLPYIKVNGMEAVNGTNVRVAIYLDGAVVMASRSTDNVLVGYTGENYSGEVVNFKNRNYSTINRYNNTLSSFILKRGYMAVLATDEAGEGYSRVYVADHGDVLVPVMPDALKKRVSSIHIRPWNYVPKKGWCSTQSNNGIWGGMGKMDATWYYTWSADRYSTNDYEYVPIKQHLYWPSWSQISGLTGSSHVLSFNEPEHGEQHTSDKCSCGGTISAWTACTKTPEFLQTGMRIGSPAPTDAGWLTDYCGHVDDMAYRCDFVAIHAYWGPNEADGASAWYNLLKSIYDKTGRPIWITEWAYGASWTKESWPSNYGDQLEKNRAAILDIVDMLERCPFVERYSYYQWDTSSRRFINDDGWVTPAGRVYRDTKSTFAYNADYQKVPNWWKPGIKSPAISYEFNDDKILFTFTNENGDYTESLVFEHQNKETGEWEKLYEVTDRYLFDGTKFSYEMPMMGIVRGEDLFRLRAVRVFGDEAVSETDLGFVKNPDCNEGTDGWTVKSLGTNTGEAFDGNASNSYWNQWYANGLNSSMSQTITDLPAGEYTVSALIRGGSNVTLTLSAQHGTENLSESATGVGNKTVEGSAYQNGWLSITLPTIKAQQGDAITITATGVGSGSAWWSVDHFQMKYVSEESLAIGDIIMDEGHANDRKDDGFVYDLQGRKMSTDPQQGLYIRNKKKYFIK